LGPYLAIHKENYKLPKDIDPKTLSFEDCLAIAKIEVVPEPKTLKKAAASKPRVTAKKATTTTSKKAPAKKKAAPKKK